MKNWAVDRRVSKKEFEVLAILAKSAGYNVTENFIGREDNQYAACLRTTLFYVYNSHPESHRKNNITVPDVSYEEAIEFLKEKIKQREV